MHAKPPLVRLTQNDVVYPRHLDPLHRAYLSDFGFCIRVQLGDKLELFARGEELMRERTEPPLAAGAKTSEAGITPPLALPVPPPVAAPRSH